MVVRSGPSQQPAGLASRPSGQDWPWRVVVDVAAGAVLPVAATFDVMNNCTGERSMEA